MLFFWLNYLSTTYTAAVQQFFFQHYLTHTKQQEYEVAVIRRVQHGLLEGHSSNWLLAMAK